MQDNWLVSDGWVYYTSSQGLYKVKTNGVQNQKLTSLAGDDISLQNNWVYFQLSNNPSDSALISTKLYRMKTDGSDMKCINDTGAFAYALSEKLFL